MFQSLTKRLAGLTAELKFLVKQISRRNVNKYKIVHVEDVYLV